MSGVQESRAEKLHITHGTVWVLGTSDEERALLDPLPEGVEVVVDRDRLRDQDDDVDEDSGGPTDDEADMSTYRSDPITAAVIVVETMDATPALLDDTLPRVGSVPLVWLVLPSEVRTEGVDQIERMAHEYGWSAGERVDLGDTWSAVRLQQD